MKDRELLLRYMRRYSKDETVLWMKQELRRVETEMGVVKSERDEAIDKLRKITSVLQKRQSPLPSFIKPPFRVGRNQQRVVLDANGLEVIAVNDRMKSMASIFCDWLNGREN